MVDTKKKYQLFRHLVQTGHTVRVWVTDRVRDHVVNIFYASIVHVVKEIIKMEQVVGELAADAGLGVTGIAVAHRDESSGPQSMKGTTSSFIEVGVAIQHRSLPLKGDEFLVPVCVEVKFAKRH